ncbi:MAG: DNA translocase FtsK 4TM domain-containing protein, partial [Flavobacteriales bacterium]|nr:DNA translocase FtsK 4TM domain-containing protein [Flavobacteriales bacterium]
MANERRNEKRNRSRNGKKSGNGPKGALAFFGHLKGFIGDGRTHRVFGLFLLVASAYLLTAFVSFFLTWKADQDLVNRSWSVILSPDVTVENWMGKLGALLSHQFIHLWFGLAAFAFVLWSFLAGIRIVLGTWLLPVTRTMGWTLFAMLWLPATLGFLFRSGELAFLGGGIGFALNNHLVALIGNFGMGTLLLFSLVGTVVYSFDLNIAGLTGLFTNKNTTEAMPEAEEGWDQVNGNRMREPVASTPDAEEAPIVDDLELEMTEEEPELGPVPELVEEVEQPTAEDLNSDEEGFSVHVAASDDKTLSEDELEKKLQEFGEYDPKLDLSSYELPSIDLLVDHGSGEITVTKEELEQNKDNIVRTLSNYNIGIEKIKATIGPTVTLYEIVPQAGVRISKIKNLEDDIALSLAALGIRIIAPIPGRGTIGIEVPNSRPQVVGMRAVVASDKFQNSGAELPIVLGKT